MALTSDRNPFFGSGLDGLGDADYTDVAAVDNLLRLCPAAAATPLHDKAADAARMGLGSLHVKDERQRMGMGGFKALGAAFVVPVKLMLRDARLVMIWPGKRPSGAGSFSPQAQAIMVFRWWRGHVFLVLLRSFIWARPYRRHLPKGCAAGAEVVIEGADYEASMAAAEAGAVTRGATLSQFHAAGA